jgi:hypothetical protein
MSGAGSASPAATVRMAPASSRGGATDAAEKVLIAQRTQQAQRGRGSGPASAVHRIADRAYRLFGYGYKPGRAIAPRLRTRSLLGGRESQSVVLDEVGTTGGDLVWIRPEVGDAADQAVRVDVEKAQPRLGRMVSAGELDPACRLLLLSDDTNDADMPVARETLVVEPHIGLLAADPLAALRRFVHHLRGEEFAETRPVSCVGGGPVFSHHLADAAHS